MNQREQAILIGVLSDVERHRRLPSPSGYGDVPNKLRKRDAMLWRVALSPGRWLQKRITASDSVLNSRAYKSLESRGLVVRLAHGISDRQTTHLELTPAGREVALHLRETLTATEGEP